MEKIKLALLTMVAVGALMFGVAQFIESRYHLFPGEKFAYVLDTWAGDVVIVAGVETIRIPLAGEVRKDR